MNEFFKQMASKANRANIAGKTRNAEAGAAALGVPVEVIDNALHIETLPGMNAEDLSCLLGITAQKLLAVMHNEHLSLEHGIAPAFMELIGC